jgi:hypothetical protein
MLCRIVLRDLFTLTRAVRHWLLLELMNGQFQYFHLRRTQP